jgi:hypothetical protein
MDVCSRPARPLAPAPPALRTVAPRSPAALRRRQPASPAKAKQQQQPPPPLTPTPPPAPQPPSPPAPAHLAQVHLARQAHPEALPALQQPPHDLGHRLHAGLVEAVFAVQLHGVHRKEVAPRARWAAVVDLRAARGGMWARGPPLRLPARPGCSLQARAALCRALPLCRGRPGVGQSCGAGGSRAQRRRLRAQGLEQPACCGVCGGPQRPWQAAQAGIRPPPLPPPTIGV